MITAQANLSPEGVFLKDFFTRDRRPTLKVIMEGGFQDSWKTLNLDVGEFFIPERTLRIHPGISYDLDLVSRLNEQWTMENVNEKPESALGIDYNFFFGIQRPRGLLVEDGRMFYDKSLLSSQPDLATRFLDHLSKEYFGGGMSFHQIYLKIQEDKNRK